MLSNQGTYIQIKRLMTSVIVSGKINNCISVSKPFSYNHPDIDLKRKTRDLKKALEHLESATSIEELLITELLFEEGVHMDIEGISLVMNFIAKRCRS